MRCREAEEHGHSRGSPVNRCLRIKFFRGHKMIHGPFFLKGELTDACVVTSQGTLESVGVCWCDNSSISSALAYILEAFLKEDGL